MNAIPTISLTIINAFSLKDRIFKGTPSPCRADLESFTSNRLAITLTTQVSAILETLPSSEHFNF